MSEFFLELFSEEIPATLQKSARENFQKNFVDFLKKEEIKFKDSISVCLLYTSPSPRDRSLSRMPSSA